MENLTLDTFRTINLKKWLVGKKVPIDDYEGFIKKDGNVVLFDHKKVKTFMDKDFVYVYFLSKENYDEFKQNNIKHTLSKMNSVIYYCDEDFFKLVGPKYTHIRRSNRLYSNIIIKNSINTDDLKIFIKKWRKTRANAHWRINTADEVYFIENYLTDSMHTLSFYNGDELVGYSVTEHIKDNIYNVLFRKTDVTLSHLTYFVDYETCKNIKDVPFYMHVGDDAGKKEMLHYKTKHFPVYNIIPSWSIKISNKKDVKPLFNLNG